MEINPKKVKYRLWEKIQDFYFLYISHFISIIVVLSFAFIEFFSNVVWSWLPITIWIFMGVISIIDGVAFVFYKLRQKTFKEMWKQNENQKRQIDEIKDNIFILFDGLLLNLAKKMGIDNDPKSRVSLYIYHKANGHFIPFGRFSSNPRLKKKSRATYPETEGCISNAWEDGWCFDNDFPTDRYKHQLKCLKKYKIMKNTHDKIKMLSQLYAVKRLDKDQKNPLAIIVFESKDKNKFTNDEVKKKFDEISADYAETISVFLEEILATSTTKGEEL